MSLGECFVDRAKTAVMSARRYRLLGALLVTMGGVFTLGAAAQSSTDAAHSWTLEFAGAASSSTSDLLSDCRRVSLSPNFGLGGQLSSSPMQTNVLSLQQVPSALGDGGEPARWLNHAAGFRADVDLLSAPVQTPEWATGFGLRGGVPCTSAWNCAVGESRHEGRVIGFQGTLGYAMIFPGGNTRFWLGGARHDLPTGSSADYPAADTTAVWSIGVTANTADFRLAGYFYSGHGRDRASQVSAGGPSCSVAGPPTGTLLETFSPFGQCLAANDSGLSMRGIYVLSGNTQVGIRYDASRRTALTDGFGARSPGDEGQRDAALRMWTVGVYRDVNSWLRFIAEFNHAQNNYAPNDAAAANGQTVESNTISVGSFFYW